MSRRYFQIHPGTQQTHADERQTTQGHRTESPTRLVDKPLEIEQCVHPHDIKALPTYTDDDRPAGYGS